MKDNQFYMNANQYFDYLGRAEQLLRGVQELNRDLITKGHMLNFEKIVTEGDKRYSVNRVSFALNDAIDNLSTVLSEIAKEG